MRAPAEAHHVASDESKPVAQRWTSNQCAAWVIFRSEAVVERARQENVDQWLEWADEHSSADALALRRRANEWQAAIDDRRVVPNEDGLFDPDKVRELFPAPTEAITTPYLQRLLQGGAERRAVRAAQKAADAEKEWFTRSEAVFEAIRVLLGKNRHQASDQDVARMGRWLEINVLPICGFGLVEAALLRAAFQKESQPVMDIDAPRPPDVTAATSTAGKATAVLPGEAKLRGRRGRKAGSGGIDDESKLREMLGFLAAKKATSVYNAARKVAAQHFAEQNRPAAIARLRRKYSALWGTVPPEGKTWADVAHELHINCIQIIEQ
jgi:hypothetical protein